MFSEDFIYYETFVVFLKWHTHRFQLWKQAEKLWPYVSKAAAEKSVPPLHSSLHSCANSTSSNSEILLQFQSYRLGHKQCEWNLIHRVWTVERDGRIALNDQTELGVRNFRHFFSSWRPDQRLAIYLTIQSHLRMKCLGEKLFTVIPFTAC